MLVQITFLQDLELPNPFLTTRPDKPKLKQLAGLQSLKEQERIEDFQLDAAKNYLECKLHEDTIR